MHDQTDADTRLHAHARAEEEANERATRLLKRIGIGALVLLAIWVPIVLVAFVR